MTIRVLKTNEDDLEDEGESESQPEIDYPSSSFKGQFITASDGEGLQRHQTALEVAQHPQASFRHLAACRTQVVVQ
ncbi:hypothetical protein OEZ85_005429 [Tetradesmus obliquus]|uniref:Uncharacterized protein n=1 Tax=Tetradesmus obliquus TaxID=3088 RepID=A0ABY8UL56_TETOB|nr:hypothetical protein OEZ85_005429 [Tetradesmus obliquus]